MLARVRTLTLALIATLTLASGCAVPVPGAPHESRGPQPSPIAAPTPEPATPAVPSPAAPTRAVPSPAASTRTVRAPLVAARTSAPPVARRTVTPKPQAAVSTPIPGPAPRPAAVYYANCTQARQAGVTPIPAGAPGYRAALDRDGDGTACDEAAAVPVAEKVPVSVTVQPSTVTLPPRPPYAGS